MIKEYLKPVNGKYELIEWDSKNPVLIGDDWVEVPKGSENFIQVGVNEITYSFYRNNFSVVCNKHTGWDWKWIKTSIEIKEHEGFLILWQRKQPQEKCSELISGKEALIALANGDSLEYQAVDKNFYPLKDF